MTEVAARELRDQYRFLGTVDEYIGLTGLEIEYDKLESTVHRKPTKTFGTLNVNKSKNRYANIDMLPCELCGRGSRSCDVQTLSHVTKVRSYHIVCINWAVRSCMPWIFGAWPAHA